MKKEFIILGLIFFASFASATTISGTLFEWYTLEPLDIAIVEIDTTPKQTIVTENGEYSFNVNPGTYNLQAHYFVENKLVYLAEESITIEEEGTFTVDLIMFPSIEEPEFLFDETDELGVPLEGLEEEPENNSGQIIGGLVLIVISLVLIFYGARKIIKSATGLETERIGIEEKYFERPKEFLKKENEIGKDELDRDTKEVLEILKRYGGRMTQKDLRDKVTFGEAKTSLVVAELEEMGKIKKFKKGRGNIIILK
ncbi:MAG: hypothetical protein ABIH20_05360 [Candidatus Diapherotrites archaeon]